MTRKPDPKAKTATLIVRANDECERLTIQYFKEVCVRDGLEMRQEILNFINQEWKQKHPPPGNPQLQLNRFGAGPSLVCSRCQNKFPSLRRVEWISGAIAHLCGECYRKDKLKHVIKRELGTI